VCSFKEIQMKAYRTHAIRNVAAVVAHFHHEVEAPAPMIDPVVHLLRGATYRRFTYNPELPALLTCEPDFPATDARWYSGGTTSYGAPATKVFRNRRNAYRAACKAG
jgi:hypothetical protein